MSFMSFTKPLSYQYCEIYRYSSCPSCPLLNLYLINNVKYIDILHVLKIVYSYPVKKKKAGTGFTCTIVNRTCRSRNGGLLKITSIIPLTWGRRERGGGFGQG